MNYIIIWHNPQCSKSRAALEILEHSDAKVEIVKYLESTPTKQEIRDILKLLNILPRNLMRTSEELYKELKLEEEMNDDALISAMANNPKLIERPIIIKNGSAIIGRPTEKIAEFLRH
ncbi:MAG: arsenate reductase (glutaredoxin) [Campylobacterales bacterium]|nr:arsenate reductase (glutaredoxin) [Campylobacterales bacterium]